MKKKITIIDILLAIVILFVVNMFFGASNKSEYSENQWYISDQDNEKIDVGIIGMRNSLNKETKKQEVIVAVIDGGIEVSNSAIANNIWINHKEIPDNGIDDDNNGFVDDAHGWNFAENNCLVDSFSVDKYELNHGTKIVGIICADPKKSKVSGVVCGDWIKIMPIKVINNSFSDEKIIASGNVKDLVKAIKYAEKMGAVICNISLNTTVDNQELKETIKESNMLFIVSAGNRNGMTRNVDKYPSYPASYSFPNLITVANIKSNGRLNSNSNYGLESVDISAPGTDIYNIDIQNRYSFGTGTSYSAPIVTATASAIYARNKNMNSKKCKQIICNTAEKNNLIEKKISNGRVINCYKALKGE